MEDKFIKSGSNNNNFFDAFFRRIRMKKFSITNAANNSDEERLRQQRETFNHKAKWALLQRRMVYTTLIMFIGFFILAIYILLNSASFSEPVVNGTVTALYGTVFGLIATVWKIVLNPGSENKLEPTIDNDPPADKSDKDIK